ncbi:hypothetical protein EJ110_NYTH54107 [Nymphaea thermarum]|nr:hypothetical protein EJ110_NYTH54107 [Nymphaea thermarum]
MAMYRQSGWTERVGLRGGGGCPGDNGGSNSNSNDHHHYHHEGGGPPPDSVSVRVAPHHRVGAAGARNRRSGRSEKALLKLSSRRGLLFILPSLLLIFVTFFAFSILSRDTKDVQHFYDQTKSNSMDGLSNATKKNAAFKVLKFGHGSVSLGRDSRYWDGDDRRRDDEYNEDAVEHYNVTISISRGRKHVREKWKNQENPSKSAEGHVVTGVSENVPVTGTFGRPPTKQTWNYKNKRLYNEGGQNELKHYEAEFQASKKKEEDREKYSSSDSHSAQKNKNKLSSMDDMDEGSQSDKIDIDDEYDIDVQDINVDDEIDGSNDQTDSSFQKYHSKRELVGGITREDSSILSERSAGDKAQNVHNGGTEGHSAKTTSLGTKSSVKRRGKRHKNTSASCGMKFLNSSSHVIEPLESKKFMRFSLHYTEREDAPSGLENWEPRFAGHQSLEEREQSFNASDQRINCGFVKGPSGFPSTGFDLAEDDMKFMSSCHIAVSSCIFGNSDRLRVPNNKMVSRLSRKSVCFVMFVDENTLETMSLEGQKPDQMGFVGLWKIVMVKNLPYSDMRRVGKVPKFLAHRLFTTARIAPIDIGHAIASSNPHSHSRRPREIVLLCKTKINNLHGYILSSSSPNFSLIDSRRGGSCHNDQPARQQEQDRNQGPATEQQAGPGRLRRQRAQTSHRDCSRADKQRPMLPETVEVRSLESDGGRGNRQADRALLEKQSRDRRRETGAGKEPRQQGSPEPDGARRRSRRRADAQAEPDGGSGVGRGEGVG